MKKILKRKRFDLVEAIQTASLRALGVIKVGDFKRWARRLNKFVDSKGENTLKETERVL